MAPIIQTIEYGHVIIALSGADTDTMRVTFHYRSGPGSEWADPVFDEDDLPNLLLAIHRAYKLVRTEEYLPTRPFVAQRAESRTRPTRKSTEAWNGQVRRITLTEAAVMLPRRIP